MTVKRRKPWSYIRFVRIAEKYATSGDLQRADRYAYKMGAKYGWLDKFFGPRDGVNPRRKRQDCNSW